MKNKQTAGSFGVIGLGRFGTALAITLSEAGKDLKFAIQDWMYG